MTKHRLSDRAPRRHRPRWLRGTTRPQATAGHGGFWIV